MDLIKVPSYLSPASSKFVSPKSAKDSDSASDVSSEACDERKMEEHK